MVETCSEAGQCNGSGVLNAWLLHYNPSCFLCLAVGLLSHAERCALGAGRQGWARSRPTSLLMRVASSAMVGIGFSGSNT